MRFPDIALLNRFYMGDTVLLEPIADILALAGNGQCYVISNYHEIFQNHPRVKGIGQADLMVNGLSVIDMTDAIGSSETLDDGVAVPIPGKMRRMYDAAGVTFRTDKQPVLYLSDDERRRAREIKAVFPGRCAGIAPESNIPVKNWPYMGRYTDRLGKQFDHLFVFSSDLPQVFTEKTGVHRVIGRPLRELMVYLSLMDCLVSVDTGIAHLALALSVPSVVCGFSIFSDLYESYSRCRYISVPDWQAGMYSCRPSRVTKAVAESVLLPRYSTTGLMLLEGLGGTVTLSDHAKKFREVTGKKPHIIVRKYRELFDGNPDIDGITVLGNPRYEECLPQMIEEFRELICIKTGVAARYVDRKRQPMSDFWSELYDSHPLGKKCIEKKYHLNMVQSANLSLGWPYENDDVRVHSYVDIPRSIPTDYVAFSNGVDTWHRGLKQTKSWEQSYWQTLLASHDVPFVQLGTEYDRYVPGAIDMRMKTTIPELLRILRDARAIVCTEGGLMHLAHAVGNENTVVMRGPTRGTFYGYDDLVNLDSYSCEACYWDTHDWYCNCPKSIDAVCMKTITPGRVKAALERIMNEDLVQDTRIAPMLLDDSVELSQESVC